MEPISALLNLGSKVIDKIFPNPEDKAKATLALEEMRQNGELARMAQETKLYEIEVDDRKSARTIHTNFVDFLAVCVVCGCTYILYEILFAGLNEKISDMTAGMIIGVFTTAITQVLAYYFGSSSSSAKKNDTIANAIKK